MLQFFKRNVIFEGVDCYANRTSVEFQEAAMRLQTAMPGPLQVSFGNYTIFFGAGIILAACIKNIWFQVADSRYRNNGQQTKSLSFLESFVATLVSNSRYIGYKPINSKICTLLGLPTSVGSLLFILASTAYLACYCFVPSYWLRGCSGFGRPPICVRAGVMAAAMTPFIYILSGKSNVITLLTGISYEKLNGFHRWSGVMTLALVLVHCIPFVYQALLEGGSTFLAETFSSEAFWSGYPPFILLVLLCLGGNSWFRARVYEGFLHLHWMCGIAYFATLVWHIHKVLNMQRYMWGALAFWSTQLIYRALVKTTFKPNALFLKPRPAIVTMLPKDSYEVVVTNVADMEWKAGQHCFLRFTGSRILDNHPFSISSIPCTTSTDSNKLRFIIVPRKGFTGKLHKELESTIILKKKVYLDGPYGGTVRDPLAFNNLSLISSGSGVTVCIPFLTYVTQHIAQSIANGTEFIPKDIHFVWIIRHEEHIDWIRDELEQAVTIAGDYVTIDIYITSRRKFPSGNIISATSSSGNTLNFGEKKKFSDGIYIHYEKPKVTDIVLSSARYLRRRAMFVSSGSESIRGSVASGVSSLQSLVLNNDTERSSPIEEIFLHSEGFGW